MTEPKRTRNANGESSIYLGKNGYWHGRVTVGVRDDGRPDRRHVERKTRADVVARVRELERQRSTGTSNKAGAKRWTVEDWLTHWVENIAAATVRPNTLSGYRVAVYKHLNPGIGAHRLVKLEPEHLERLYKRMLTKSRPATVHQVHRTVRTALGEAERRGNLNKNPAALAKPPRVTEEDVEPYSVEEIQALLKAAAERRNTVRWAIALALGLRQGEALGLKWSDVDLEAKSLTVRRSRVRPRWQHGCDGTCGRKIGGHCPQRLPVRPETDETKSRAGRRIIGLPDEIVRLIEIHRTKQDAERETAGSLWVEGGWLFATPVGRPTNPRTDYTEWKRLLKLAGVRDGRLHDARHTAATVLLLLGVPDRAVMSMMGWSQSAMAARYQHITAPIRRDVADRLGFAIWPTESTPTETESETN